MSKDSSARYFPKRQRKASKKAPKRYQYLQKRRTKIKGYLSIEKKYFRIPKIKIASQIKTD